MSGPAMCHVVFGMHAPGSLFPEAVELVLPPPLHPGQASSPAGGCAPPRAQAKAIQSSQSACLGSPRAAGSFALAPDQNLQWRVEPASCCEPGHAATLVHGLSVALGMPVEKLQAAAPPPLTLMGLRTGRMVLVWR
ncbi:hypothetical protein P4O66_021865 [Electrophorus voltai]|uniref:Uncharacterized protein n=1 Tax=Electrophorus voltai TaxID=2609070 RepID=A0AAD8ZMS7_9TELE|nr:hypothetical protein P4O66_021865 [Electrophorus voltai]